MALVESEWMTRERRPCPPAINHARALSIAVTSASKTVCWVPRDSLLWAGPVLVRSDHPP